MAIQKVTIGDIEDIKPGMWITPFDAYNFPSGGEGERVILVTGGIVQTLDYYGDLQEYDADQYEIMEAPKKASCLVTSGIEETRNYVFYIKKRPNRDPQVIAGCRDFTVAEAYDYWNAETYTGSGSVVEIRKILDKLVKQAKKLGMLPKAKKSAPKRKAKRSAKRRTRN